MRRVPDRGGSTGVILKVGAARPMDLTYILKVGTVRGRLEAANPQPGHACEPGVGMGGEG